jgi:hypothetical protein
MKAGSRIWPRSSRSSGGIDRAGRREIDGHGQAGQAYKKDGNQYGVIEVELNLILTKIVVNGDPLPLAAGSSMKQTRFDGCIDGWQRTGRMETVLDTKLITSGKNADGKEFKIVRESQERGSKEEGPLREEVNPRLGMTGLLEITLKEVSFLRQLLFRQRSFRPRGDAGATEPAPSPASATSSSASVRQSRSCRTSR